MGVFLLPLASDVARALILALPQRLRWSTGQAGLLALLALGMWRLWRVKPTDAWPAPPGSLQSVEAPAASRCLPWALRLAVVSLTLPIMTYPDGLGFADWDFVLDKFEALRRTILIWGQFPWWNPWCRGGFPLAAEPEIGVVSPATPLVLAFGSSIGLRLAAILCLLVALEGAYRLAWLWFREPWSSAATALIYGLNGAVIIDTTQGYVLAMSYCSLPWLAFYAFRIGGRFADGLCLGVWLAFVGLNGIQYLSLYATLLASLIWLRAFRVQAPMGRVRVLVNTLGSLGVFLALCGWRLATVLPVLLDDKRERVTFWDLSVFDLFHYLLDRPPPDWSTILPGHLHAVYISTVSYVGPVVLLLGVASLASGWRWWHTLIFVCGWLAIGAHRWYQPSTWLADWPIFSSTHVVTRWRFVALLGLGLAAASVLARWRNSGSRTKGSLAILATLIIAADYVSLAYQQFPLAFSIKPEPQWFPGPAVPTIVNVRDGLGYPCAMRGYGVIRGYEPMLSYRRDAPTLRKAREAPDYSGEAWTDSGEIQPVFWSPNRLVFQVAPGQQVSINQNPGSWWWVNGHPAFPGRRCAEPEVPFVAWADDHGRLELQIHPRGLSIGIGLHALGVILLGMALRATKRLRGSGGGASRLLIAPDSQPQHVDGDLSGRLTV
jgi:hypothetical protein